jgi:hypothetical protein
MKCPTCYAGDLYQDSNPFHLKKLHIMHAHCNQCGQNFNPEPGFYYGAMYASYGLAVGLFLFYFFLFELFYPVSGLFFMSLYTLTLLVIFPYLFRYSRVIYIHLFYGYNPGAKKKYQAENPITPKT